MWVTRWVACHFDEIQLFFVLVLKLLSKWILCCHDEIYSCIQCLILFTHYFFLSISYCGCRADFYTCIQLHSIYPSKAQSNFHCIFSSLPTASLPGTTTAHQLVQAIRQKCTADEVLAILNELPNPENDNEMIEMTYNPLKIDVFVQTLLNLGKKSFSHSFAAIAKFHQVFKVSITHSSGNHELMILITIDHDTLIWFTKSTHRPLPNRKRRRFVCCIICTSCGVIISKWCAC